MSQSTTKAPRKARVLRLWLDITDDQGQTKRYCCYPVKPADLPAGALKGYALTRHDPADGTAQARYVVALAGDGSLACDCPGHQHCKHCKHASCLVAAGMLARDELLAIRQAHLEATQLRADLATARDEHLARASDYHTRLGELEARDARPKPRPRRRKPAPAETAAA